MKFNKKVAVITGAGRGIGFEIAKQFLLQKAKIAVLDVNTDQWNNITSENSEIDSNDIFLQNIDITNKNELEISLQKVTKKFGHIDILVNNAGVNRDGLMIKMAENDWDTVINVNLKATFLITQIVSKIMIDKKTNGKIINIVSTAGKHGNFGQANYAASKGGLYAFTKTVARELGKYNIRVNAVMPGLIDTPMTQAMNPVIKEKRIKEIPLRRIGSPIDIAHAVLFLSSPESSYITGSVIQVDGGLRM